MYSALRLGRGRQKVELIEGPEPALCMEFYRFELGQPQYSNHNLR
jgi:hypothetical protein